MTYFNRISCALSLPPFLSLSVSPLKGESVPLNIWEVGFIFELVYIIRTWKFVEIKCMRDWLCVCERDESLKLFKPLKLRQCCPLKLVYACIPPFWMVDWGRAARLVLKIAITCPLPLHSSPFPLPTLATCPLVCTACLHIDWKTYTQSKACRIRDRVWERGKYSVPLVVCVFVFVVQFMHT